MGDNGSAYRVLVGKPKGKSSPRKPRRRCGNNIKTDYTETDWVVD
jgi:hypothetical protein